MHAKGLVVWKEILAHPEYADFRKASRALRRYARTVALANLGRTKEARLELSRFDSAAAEVPEASGVQMSQRGIVVEERVAHAFPSNKHNETYLRTKAARGGHAACREGCQAGGVDAPHLAGLADQDLSSLKLCGPSSSLPKTKSRPTWPVFR